MPKFTARVDLTKLPVENRHFYTGMTGSGATNLDGEVTTSLAVDSTFRWIIISGSLSIWQLVAGSDAEDTNVGVVRPDDWNGSTNAKVWKRVLGF